MASNDSDLAASIGLLQRQINCLVQNQDYKRAAIENLTLIGSYTNTEFKLLSSIQMLLLFLANTKFKTAQQQQSDTVKKQLREFKTYFNRIDKKRSS